MTKNLELLRGPNFLFIEYIFIYKFVSEGLKTAFAFVIVINSLEIQGFKNIHGMIFFILPSFGFIRQRVRHL